MLSSRGLTLNTFGSTLPDIKTNREGAGCFPETTYLFTDSGLYVNSHKSKQHQQQIQGDYQARDGAHRPTHCLAIGVAAHKFFLAGIGCERYYR